MAAFVKWRYEREVETVGLMRDAGISLLAGLRREESLLHARFRSAG